MTRRKYLNTSQERLLEIPRGWGSQMSKFVKKSENQNWNFKREGEI